EPSISAKSVTAKLKNIGVNIFRSTVLKHLTGFEYKMHFSLYTNVNS
ncbi:18265_t:CDS:1, partial [Funneliformis geosporum]